MNEKIDKLIEKANKLAIGNTYVNQFKLNTIELELNRLKDKVNKSDDEDWLTILNEKLDRALEE